MAVTKVTLRPEIRFSGEKQPTKEELRQLHDKAHHACFIANSVKIDVIVELV
jgi:organic hydroperoxide reductase OsmC/OhrA